MAEYYLKDCKGLGGFYEVEDSFKKAGGAGKRWIFRGYIPENALKSTLDCGIRFYPPDLKDRRKAEESLLREFKRRYHQYSSDVPKEKDCLEWLSIMRHYGAPTRLLDFSYSFYIAAYFALERTAGANEFEIVAVNPDWAIKQSIKNCGGNPDDKTHFFWKLIGNGPTDRNEFIKYFWEEPSKTFVLPINPFRLIERLCLQKGVFMCPGNVSISFDDNLKSLSNFDHKENIARYIFKLEDDEITKLREYLYDLNITGATLLPGLDGFARSLMINPPKFAAENSSS